MRAYTHGVGTPTASQHNFVDSEKLKVFLVLLTGFEPTTFDLQSNALTTEPTRHPHGRYWVLFLPVTKL